MEKSEFAAIGSSFINVDENCDSFAIVQEDNLDNDIGYSSVMQISNLRIQQLPGSIVAPKDQKEVIEEADTDHCDNSEEKVVRFESKCGDEEKPSVGSDMESTINTIRLLKEKSENLEQLIADTNMALKRRVSEMASQKRLFEEAITDLREELEKKKVEVEDLKEANLLLKRKVSEALKSNDSSLLKNLVNGVSDLECESAVAKEKLLVNEYEEMCRSVERLKENKLLNESSGVLDALEKQSSSNALNSFEDLREKLTDFGSLSEEFDSVLTEAVKQRKEKECTIKIAKKIEEEQNTQPKTGKILTSSNTTAEMEPKRSLEAGKASKSSFASFQNAKRLDLHLCMKCMKHFNGEEGTELHNKSCKPIF